MVSWGILYLPNSLEYIVFLVIDDMGLSDLVITKRIIGI